MSVKAIFTRSNLPLWVDVAKYLQMHYGWSICYWIGWSEIKSLVLDSICDTTFHDLFDAMRGIPAKAFSEIELEPLDQETLEKFSIHESYTLKMMDRMDPGGNFSYQDRINLYHQNLRYWKSMLQLLKPDVVLFPTSPHHIHDYILYALCCSQGIQTIVLARTNIVGLILIMERFEQGCKPVIQHYEKLRNAKQLKSFPLSQNAENYLKKLNGSHAQALPEHTKYKLQHQKYSNKFTVHVGRKIDRLMDLIYNGPQKDYLKHNKLSITKYQTSRLKWLRYKQQVKRTKNKLIGYYTIKSKRVKLDVPYLFVALQCQPERNTSPDGGMFAHQFLMIDLLSKIIPAGWFLYVKEHISQFRPYQRAESGRNISFYEDILSLPNARLISLSMNTFEMIDHSMAVATVSGSVGFEAVNRGKPVFLFGHAWYRGCEGVFYTPTRILCENALSLIRNGYCVDKKKIKLFVHVLEKYGIQGYIDNIYDKISPLSNHENTSSVAKAIGTFYLRLSEDGFK